MTLKINQWTLQLHVLFLGEQNLNPCQPAAPPGKMVWFYMGGGEAGKFFLGVESFANLKKKKKALKSKALMNFKDACICMHP